MNRLDRQSFLGPRSEEILQTTTLGLVGLGGGGSHEVQQLAHVGAGSYVLVDPDIIDLTNTNRLIGGTIVDVKSEMPKVKIAERLIRSLQPTARVVPLQSDWRLVLDDLKDCDLLMGAVDTFKDRDQLERFARRFMISYIDIGMDIISLPNERFLISGQVILSTPGGPCLRCCNFINDERLAREEERYGAAGPRPQVVWPNGVLASTAVGIAIRLLAPWHDGFSGFVYLEYDGNRNTISPSAWMEALSNHVCPHYPETEVGDPSFDLSKALKDEGGCIKSEATPARRRPRIALRRRR
ncbi:MAG: ThiF family adenylyltransferase [Candidatus Binataceae bacterium]